MILRRLFRFYEIFGICIFLVETYNFRVVILIQIRNCLILVCFLVEED